MEAGAPVDQTGQIFCKKQGEALRPERAGEGRDGVEPRQSIPGDRSLTRVKAAVPLQKEVSPSPQRDCATAGAARVEKTGDGHAKVCQGVLQEGQPGLVEDAVGKLDAPCRFNRSPSSKADTKGVSFMNPAKIPGVRMDGEDGVMGPPRDCRKECPGERRAMRPIPESRGG